MTKISSYTLKVPSELWVDFLNTFPRAITIQERFITIIEKEIKEFQDNGGKFLE